MALVKLDPKSRKLKEKADKAYTQRKWDKARQLYHELKAMAPFDPRVGIRIGDLCRRLKKNGQAISEYKEVVHHYSREGFWAKSIAVSKMILEIDPNELSVRDHLAYIYSMQGMGEQTVPGDQPPSAPPEPQDHQAISLAEAEPRAMEEGPDPNLLGASISISGQEPYGTSAEAPVELELTPDQEVQPAGRAPIPLLSSMRPDEVSAVIDRLAVRKYAVGSLVCEEGDVGDSMYIVADGAVEVSVRDKDGSPLVLAELRDGEFFGEFSLITKGERNATVQAKTELELLEITSGDFDIIASQHPRVWNILESYLRDRIVDTIFSKSEVFRVLTTQERQELSGLLSHRVFRMDELVMAEGTAGEEMFFVKSGALTVTVQKGDSRIMVAELGPGDYFGEVAMLTGRPRTASVTAKKETELFCLSRREAAVVLKNNKEILILLKSKMEARKGENEDVFLTYDEARATLDLV